MKIVIVSDTHNNWANFKKAIEWAKKENIGLILHCGDVMSQQVVDDATKLFSAEIKFVKGNADWDLDLPENQELEFPAAGGSASGGNSKKIGFVHYPSEAKKMAQSGKYDLVFYGHTHRAWDEKIGAPAGGSCHMINPGELAGQFFKPTFAVYDSSNGNLELKILEKI